MMGTTILYSSGDSGVAGFRGVCLDASGKCRTAVVMTMSHSTLILCTGNPAIQGIKFNPDFPATCPFVTAVGATQINPSSTVKDPESACEQVIFSGGGFSNIFPMPDYQEYAVRKYLKDYPPPYTSQQYNNSGTVMTRLPCEWTLNTDGIVRFAHTLICLLTGKIFCNPAVPFT
jgi:tripeptidyl-peptidase I